MPFDSCGIVDTPHGCYKGARAWDHAIDQPPNSVSCCPYDEDLLCAVHFYLDTIKRPEHKGRSRSYRDQHCQYGASLMLHWDFCDWVSAGQRGLWHHPGHCCPCFDALRCLVCCAALAEFYAAAAGAQDLGVSHHEQGITHVRAA